MPIYMDLHIVPGVKAKGVAEAHQMDVKLEDEFSCKCMTYWVDESRGNVFCLIDAPSKEVVVAMHSKAHGLIPHRIIEVESSIVESFLGRVSDPEEAVIDENGLKVFDESSFRILVTVKTTDPVLLCHQYGAERAKELLQQFYATVRKQLAECAGRETEYGGDGFVISFTSAAKAVSCALSIARQLPDAKMECRINLTAGEPVTQNEKLFGDTLRTANRLCFISQDARPIVTSAVKELVAKDHFGQGRNEQLVALTPADENFLYVLFTALEENATDPDFLLDDYCHTLAMSKSQLYRKTLSLTGFSPNALLKEYRLHNAKKLLQKKQQSVAEVSFETGFTSPSYFTKCFKKRYDMLPLAYIEQL